MDRKSVVLCMLYASHAAYVHAVITWNNQSGIHNGTAYAPVTDQALTIQGTNTIDGRATIEAISADVTVTVASTSIVQADATPNRVLHLYAAAGRTILFNIDNDLSFLGGGGEFLMTFSGLGNLEFDIDGNKTLLFGPSATNQGTYFLVATHTGTSTPETYSVSFRRSPSDSNPNGFTFVRVGYDSMISFMSPTRADASPTDSSVIEFNPSVGVTNTGRLIFWIDDNGAFLDQGLYLTNADIATMTLADVNFRELGGLSTEMLLRSDAVTTSTWAGLLVVNENTHWEQLRFNPFCEALITGTQRGFVVGANGNISLTNNTYFDYVGTVTNYTIVPDIPAQILDGRFFNTVIKDRNPSALIIDGLATTDTNITTTAEFIFTGTCAMYFRSGVSVDGVATFTVIDARLGSDPVVSFTIAPEDQFGAEAASSFAGAYGSIVLDVEGNLNVVGLSDSESVLNILSLYVTPTGGSVLIESNSTNFPLRSYLTDQSTGDYLQYQLACFQINGRMNLFDTALQHSDELHLINRNNFPQQSAATYVGGDTWLLCTDRDLARPTIAFYKSNLLLHTSAALAGVDLVVPEYAPSFGAEGNRSNFTFYQNGYCIDNGDGRNLILGTDVGGYASDFSTIIDNNSYLNVYQENAQSPAQTQRLTLLSAPNNYKITQDLTLTGTPIATQYSVHSLFTGHASNIAIGTNADTGTSVITGESFALTTLPTLYINGNFFSFETQGGDTNQPDLSVETGQGGIYVDKNGTLEISNTVRASFSSIISKSHNGVVDLPKRQVFFHNRIGIAQWALDLAQPDQVNIVGQGESLSDYTLDWRNATKNTCSGAFVPYEPPSTPAACQQQAVVYANLTSVPTVLGNVQQLQIINSRLGDQAHLIVDGGTIGELVMLSDDSLPGSANVGVIITQNDAIVGLGTATRNLDSGSAQVVLGINGITLVPNGDSQIILNSDVLINNLCTIVSGTAFGETEQFFQITSTVPKELRVKKDGILDLTSMTSQNQVVRIGGQVKLVFEPGARLLMGGGRLTIGDEAQVVFEPYLDVNQAEGDSINATDAFRTKICGSGQILLRENAQMSILRGAYVGIESAGVVTVADDSGTIPQDDTLINCSYVTTLTLRINDSGALYIGSSSDFGGTFQIGNTTDQSENDASIDFTLLMDGEEAFVDVDSQGFFGIGAGIASKPQSAPDNWLVGTLFNVDQFTFTLTNGIFQSNQIQIGSSPLASLIAIGTVTASNFSLATPPAGGGLILGGSNLVQLLIDGPLHTFVGNTAGSIDDNYNAGLFASSYQFYDPKSEKASFTTYSPPNYAAVGMTASQLFTLLRMPDYQNQGTKTAAITGGRSTNTLVIGYVNNSVIYRSAIKAIRTNTGYADAQPSLNVGTVIIDITTGGIIVHPYLAS